MRCRSSRERRHRKARHVSAGKALRRGKPRLHISKSMLQLPLLYPILDTACFPDVAAMLAVAEELAAAGCTLLQYRNKSGNARQMLDQACELRARLGSGLKLVMNDRADLCLAAGFDGLHVGQDDLSPKSARRIIGSARWLGVSTHNPEQLAEAGRTSADYLAIGPVFATTSKANPDPVVGLEGVRRARELTRKPLVAIGGITRANARSVIEAGADSVAVISDLLREPRKSAEEFLMVLG
jgi:thiamine-phosphate pyrophosphorylase